MNIFKVLVKFQFSKIKLNALKFLLLLKIDAYIIIQTLRSEYKVKKSSTKNLINSSIKKLFNQSFADTTRKETSLHHNKDISGPMLASLINLTHESNLNGSNYCVNFIQSILQTYMEAESRPSYDEFIQISAVFKEFLRSYTASKSFSVFKAKFELKGINSFKVFQ